MRAGGGESVAKGKRRSGALSDLYTPDTHAQSEDQDVGARLLKGGLIDPERLTNAQRVLRDTPGRHIGQILVDMGVDEASVQEVVAEVARLPFERVATDDVNAYEAKALHRLGTKYCRANVVLPLRREGTRLVVGTASPHDVFVLDDIKRQLGVPSIKHVLLTSRDIQAVIESLTEAEPDDYDVGEMLTDVDEDDVEVVEEKDQGAGVEDAESSPVVRFVNHIIQAALKEGASDIHIEPEEKVLKVRFRVDGVLFDAMNPPKKMHAAMTSRIKIMANLDIAERRLPQDGRIRATVLGRKLDLRVSTMPTSTGEKVVMRILDNRAIKVPLEELGFVEETLGLFDFSTNNTTWSNRDIAQYLLNYFGPTTPTFLLAGQTDALAVLDHPAVLEDEDVVRPGHGPQSVGDDDSGAMFQEVVDGALDQCFCGWVETGRCFVEHDNTGIL